MNPSPRCAVAAALLGLLGCGCDDNLTHPEGPEAFEPAPVTPLACVPNLDGRIEADELAPALGVPVSFLVSPDGVERGVDLAGVVDEDGRRVWDWAAEDPTDQVATFQAAAITGRWYASSFPSGAFVVPIDAGLATEGVYTHDEDAILLHGLASAEEAPIAGQSLLVYETPIAVYRFPLEPGQTWTTSGDVKNGVLFGLPYAGRDTYEVSVEGGGRLMLPDLSFSQALRVSTRVVVSPAVGAPTSRRQVSFLFECFGEVARATSRADEEAEDFGVAAEVRRLGL